MNHRIWYRYLRLKVRTHWKGALFGVFATFLALPLLTGVRDTFYKKLLEQPDYLISVYVCAPIGVMYHKLIDSEGKEYPLEPQYVPTTFEVILKNVGTKVLQNNEFLLIFSKDSSKANVKDSPLVISETSVGTSSPIDIKSFEASVANNQLRVVAKSLNPGDFIYVEGNASRPPSIDVFSRSVGLTSNESRGPARCSLWPINLGKVFIFFQQNQNESTEENK